jgi:type VI secretion system protein ImpB
MEPRPPGNGKGWLGGILSLTTDDSTGIRKQELSHSNKSDILMPWDRSPAAAIGCRGALLLQRNLDMAESLQHKLDRVRSPRVHITYDVETGGAIEKKELPFVMGVFGDFTGQPEEPLPRLKDRKFVEVNPDNFDSVLAAMKPHLSFQVENKISDDPEAGQVKVNLKFRSMDDFEPTQVAKQIKPLAELLELRTKLSDLRGNLQGNDKLDDLLQAALRDSTQLDKLKSEIAESKGEKGGVNE